MNSSVGVTLRLFILISVVLGMPLLAVPQAQRSLTHWHAPWNRTGVLKSTSGEDLVVDAGNLQSSAGLRVKSRHSGQTQPANSWHRASRPGGYDLEPERDALVKLTLSSSLQQRLEGLGAQYLVVERLEVSGLYRCVCLVDVPGTTYQRPFEAADLLPEKAVQRVLIELESWRLAMGETRAND